MEELRSHTDGMIRESRYKPQHKATGGTRQKGGVMGKRFVCGSWDHAIIREGMATVRIHTPTLSRERKKKYPGLSLPPHSPVSLQCLFLGGTNRKPGYQRTWEMEFSGER